MSTSTSPSIIERLPIELLEQIFLFTSAQDILRLSLVNHTFYGLVRASLSIQYEIDLFGAGLQRNPRTKKSLADCHAALATYCKRWENFDPAEKWDRVFDVSDIREAVAVSGVYGLLWKNSVKFFTLGSVSRGIPKREWDISFRHLEAKTFTFYPQANIMAIVEEVAWTWIIHLSTMDDREPRPTAKTRALSYTFAPENGSPINILEMSITGCRLAVLRGASDEHIAQVVVWDWITGQILLELENEFYRSANFIDDYWLAFALASRGPDMPPELVLLNTERTAVDPALVQTTFHLNGYGNEEMIYLHLDQGGHKPSREDGLFAPFYLDPSQRILGIDFYESNCVFVVKTERLLQLAQERGCADVLLEELNAHIVEIQAGGVVLWISSPRICSIYQNEAEESWMEVYDFSAGACGGRRETIAWEDGSQPATGPILGLYQLPWNASRIHFANGGHDSIALLMDPGDDEDPRAGTMHIWNF